MGYLGIVPGNIGPHTVLTPLIKGARTHITMPFTTVLDIPARVSQIVITIPTDREHNRNAQFALDAQGIFYNVQEFDDVTHWYVPEDQASRARTIISQPGKYFGGLGRLGFLAGPVARRIAKYTSIFTRDGRDTGMGAITRVALLTRLPSPTPTPTPAPSPAPVIAPIVSPTPATTREIVGRRTGIGPGSTAGEIPMALPYDPAYAQYYAQTTARIASGAIASGVLPRYQDELARYEQELRAMMEARLRELIAAGWDPEAARLQVQREFDEAMAMERQRLMALATEQSTAIVDQTALVVDEKIKTGELKPESKFPWWIVAVGAMFL